MTGSDNAAPAAPAQPKTGTSPSDSPTPAGAGTNAPAAPLPKPYLAPDGTLVIPFDSEPKYHWWVKGAQSIEKTKAELRAAGPPAS